MRDREKWIKLLKKEMGGESPPIAMKFTDFARTELLLYALYHYFSDRSIQKAHLLMQGYREPNMTDEQWDILSHLRHLAPEFRSSISWEIALRSYEEIAKNSAGWLGFEIDLKLNTISLTNKMVVQRYSLYEQVLNQILLFKTKTYKPASAGDYEFNLDSLQTRVIRIPPEIANIGIENGDQIPSIKLSKDLAPIRISLTDLIKKGTELQSVLGYDAGEILGRSNYWDLQKNRSAREILIDKEGHILGPTGSGKSTLIDCLVKCLIDRSHRVAISTNSVGEVQAWLDFAQKVGIAAVPIIGDSERHKHLSRLNQAIIDLLLYKSQIIKVWTALALVFRS